MKNFNRLIWAFNFGFAATLIFHQGGLLGLWSLGVIPSFPWNMSPVPPFDVPKVLSLAFFGGLWGLPAYALTYQFPKGTSFWLSQILFGAIFPTAVAMLIVFPLKGIDVSIITWSAGFFLNGLWGLGVAIGFYFLLSRKK
jgi:hypothetical protein